MPPLFFLWLFSIAGLAASAPPRGRPVDFSMVVAGCFRGDTVTVAVNGQDLLRQVVATSDFSTGVTDIGVYQDAHGLWVRELGRTTKYQRLNLRQGLRVRFVLNGQASNLVVDLDRGWVVFFNACYQVAGTGAPTRRLTVQQYKKSVALE